MRFLRRFFFVLFVAVLLLLIGAQIASSFFLKPLLQQEARRIFKVPVLIQKAGANLLGGSFWMKGVRMKNARDFKEPDFLSGRTIAIDLSLLSFLTNQFVVDRILLKDTYFTIEVNDEGTFNISEFADRIIDRLRKFLARGPKILQLMTSYTIEKVAIRNGTVRFIDQREPEKNWTLQSISFSLARILYPPDPEEALPTALYVNATIPGVREGKLLILGRLNPFVDNKSFDITGSVKNLAFRELSVFLPEFPLKVTDGILHLKVKALCHDNQVDIYHQVHVEKLRFEAPETVEKKVPVVFGLPRETVIRFFNELKPAAEPFDFEFRVTGNLADPKFDIVSAIREKIYKAIYDHVTIQMKAIEIKSGTSSGRDRFLLEGLEPNLSLPRRQAGRNGTGTVKDGKANGSESDATS